MRSIKNVALTHHPRLLPLLLRTAITLVLITVFVGKSVSAEDISKTPKESRVPNVVLILADDLGYGDLGCYGNEEIRTPHLDQFAAGGLRLTSCYAAAANCSPARAGLMTGRTPTRVGIHNWIPMHCPMHLRRWEITIAKLLADAGYDTCHVGKWHLNGQFNHADQPQPDDHGFRHWFSTQNNALPNHRNPDNFVRNFKPVGKLEGFSADVVSAEAARWLAKGRDKSKPFFLFVCFHEPHEPIASAKQFTDMYSSDDPSYAAHHGNISQMDAGFGKIIKAIDDLNVRENTFVFFTSDNGPAITNIHPHGSSGGLRDKKGFLYEGGIRVPGMVQWPGRVKPGSTSDEPVCGVDLMPTLCEMLKIDLPADRTIDGASFAPVFSGKPVERKRPLYWHFNRAQGEAKVAIRDGEWKLLARLNVPSPKPSGGITADEMKNLKTAELAGFELYNLKSDAGEQRDVQEQHPGVFKRLQEEMARMYREVRAEAPTWPEWEFARYEAQRIEWPEYSQKNSP